VEIFHRREGKGAGAQHPATMKRSLAVLAALAVTLFAVRGASADAPPLRVGFIATFSGGFTQAGKSSDAAVAAFIKEHGDSVAGRKLVIIKRDDGGNAPDTAKRLAQELIIADHVDFLMGLTFSPNAKAVGDVSTSAKMPVFITNAASNGILEPNPYLARFSYTEGQLTQPLAQWALKNNIKNVYAIYLDYATGIDAAAGFAAAFTAGGGKIAGEVRVPLSAQDFSAYVQRIRDAHPQAVFAFLTVSGGPFLKAWDAAGGAQSGIKILATGDLTAESSLPGLGDSALGVITAMNYSATHDSALNRQLTRDMHAVDPSIDSPDFGSVATYDALQAIYKVTAAQNGSLDPDKTMALVKGLKLESPRGPIQIDPQTRDIVQNIYVRRVDKVDGKYQNTEIATYPMVKDPLEK
jgi:branched-chain amino acid transport system substrate-binding protein